MTLRNLLIFFSSALVLAACGGTAAPASGVQASAAGKPSTAASIAAYQGADRQQLLEDGARKEGTIQLYTSLAGDVIDGITKGFQGKYPFVKVEVYRGNGDDIMQRVNAEQSAKKYIADVIDTDDDTMRQLRSQNLLTPFFSPNAAAFPADTHDKASNGLDLDVASIVLYMSFAYNTKALPESAVPKTYQDLLNPALKGKMAITGSGNSGPRWVGLASETIGEDMVKKIATTQAVQVQMVAAKAVMDLITSGEIPSSPTIYRDHAEQAAAAGAPVKWVPLEPVVGSFSGPSVPIGVPHPNAAMLMVDYFLSPEFQKLQAQYQMGSPALDPGFKFGHPGRAMDAAAYGAAFKNWQTILRGFGQ